MPKIIITEIRDKYADYTTLLTGRKSVFEQVINITEKKGNNKNFLTNRDVNVKHSSLTDAITLIAEVRVDNYKYFNFKLRCRSLSEVPFFRFDSDGETHRNYDDSIPLSEQQITTPHFHRFNENGLLIAYKTDKLLNEQERIALEDISLCVIHFCHESNIRLNDDDFPGISIMPGTFQFETENNDPNKGVNFA